MKLEISDLITACNGLCNVQETDKHLAPVLAILRREDTDAGQTRLDSYFSAYHDNVKFAVIRSERLEGAISGRTGRTARPRIKSAKMTQQQDKETLKEPSDSDATYLEELGADQSVSMPLKRKNKSPVKEKQTRPSRQRRGRGAVESSDSDDESGYCQQGPGEVALEVKPRRNPGRQKRPRSMKEISSAGKDGECDSDV